MLPPLQQLRPRWCWWGVVRSSSSGGSGLPDVHSCPALASPLPPKQWRPPKCSHTHPPIYSRGLCQQICLSKCHRYALLKNQERIVSHRNDNDMLRENRVGQTRKRRTKGRHLIRYVLELAMRLYLPMCIDAHRMRISRQVDRPCSCGHFEMRLTYVGLFVPKL